jgi:hypothetical protein
VLHVCKLTFRRGVCGFSQAMPWIDALSKESAVSFPTVTPPRPTLQMLQSTRNRSVVSMLQTRK